MHTARSTDWRLVRTLVLRLTSLLVGLLLAGCVTDQEAAIQRCRVDLNPDYLARMTPAEKDVLSERQQRCLATVQAERQANRAAAAAILAEGVENAGKAYQPMVQNPAPHMCTGSNIGGIVNMNCF
jgi:hypothetical protein